MQYDKSSWTEAEDKVLKDNRKKTIKELEELLPHRSPSGIKSRRFRLGLTNRKRITNEQKLYMKDNFEIKTIEEIAQDLGAHKTTVETNLYKMGLLIREKDKVWTMVNVESGMENDGFFIEMSYEFKKEED